MSATSAGMTMYGRTNDTENVITKHLLKSKKFATLQDFCDRACCTVTFDAWNLRSSKGQVDARVISAPECSESRVLCLS